MGAPIMGGYGFGGMSSIAFILVLYVLLVIVSEVIGYGGYGVDP